MRTVVVIGDLHLPWACIKTVAKIYQAIEAYRPYAIVQIGDLYDFFSYSRFPKKQGIITPGQEIADGREWAEAFWKNCKKASLRSKCFQILGNHDIRPILRVTDMIPELAPLVQKGWENLFKFPSVETLLNTRDDLCIDGVIYEHGAYSRPGQHMRENMMNTVIGHTHRGYVHFEAIRSKQIFELNVGYAADPVAEPLCYTRKKYSRWTHGFGVIDSRGPRFCPLP